MLLVKTKLGVSSIHGIGLFADQFIPENTVIWRYDPAVDLKLSPGQIESLAESSREQIRKYTYREFHSDMYVLCGDDARFFNHAPAIANCIDVQNGSLEGDVTLALRDIEEGEELTCDYAMFDMDLIEGRYRI